MTEHTEQEIRLTNFQCALQVFNDFVGQVRFNAPELRVEVVRLGEALITFALDCLKDE